MLALSYLLLWSLAAKERKNTDDYDTDMTQWANTRKKIHSGRTIMHCLSQRIKSTFFEKFLSGGFSKGTRIEEIFFQKMLILVFEVIVQLPKHTSRCCMITSNSAHCPAKTDFFLCFSTLCTILNNTIFVSIALRNFRCHFFYGNGLKCLFR